MEEEHVRQKYMQLQMATEQMKQIQAQMQTLESKNQELIANIQSLADIKGFSERKMLTPIADNDSKPLLKAKFSHESLKFNELKLSDSERSILKQVNPLLINQKNLNQQAVDLSKINHD